MTSRFLTKKFLRMNLSVRSLQRPGWAFRHDSRAFVGRTSGLLLGLLSLALLAWGQPMGRDQSNQFPNLPGLIEGGMAWGDYDQDGRLDLFITGNETPEGKGTSKLYHNTGGDFDDQTSLLPGLPQLGSSAAAWGDYDNDGRLDLMITGGTLTERTSKLYHNTGTGFEDQSSLLPGLPQVWNGSLAWADYDNDGRADLLLTGSALGIAKPVSKLYHNLGNGFEDQSRQLPNLPGVQHSAVAWGDYDRDGRLDLIITGYTGPGSGSASKLYHNTGNGFEDQSGLLPSLPGISDGSLAWGDYDNDGWLDLMLTGQSGPERHSKLYHNTGNGFEDQSSQLPGLSGVQYSAVGWGDYDNDGRLDLILTGDTGSELVARLYHNTTNGFASISLSDLSLPRISVSSVVSGDYDNDQKLDLLLTGYSSSGPISRLIHNLIATANEVPTAPTSLSSQVMNSGQRVKLSWQAANDGQTPQLGLTYNLYVSDTPGGQNILSPMANQKTGYRRVVQLGNSQILNFSLEGLTVGKTYYWSVQAIDGAFAGSAFAPEQSFTISSVIEAEHPLQLIAPLYNCQSGTFTFQTTGGDGSPVDYMAPGITAWTSNPRQFVDLETRTAADAQPITLVARQSSKEVRYVWDIRVVCPVGDPNQLRLLAPVYDCQSGAFTFQSAGGNSSSIEYMAAGITAWTTNPHQFVDLQTRTAADAEPLVLKVRQKGPMGEVQQDDYVWDIRAVCPVSSLEDHCPCVGFCVGSSRQGVVGEPGTSLQATVYPNPAESELTVRIEGVQNQQVKLNLMNLSGQVVMERKVEAVQSAHQERLSLEGLPSGLYLLRINAAGKSVSLKVVKQ
jgi:hypothetical protein